MKNLSGTPNYENLHPSLTKKKPVTVKPTVTVLLKKKEIEKMIADFQSIQDRCEKLYEVRSLKELHDINITLHMVHKHFKSLFEYSE
jgi:hypothetical protein